MEYAGISGSTQDCVDAVKRLIQYGDQITLVRILSFSGTHCLLLTVNNGDSVAIKSGFTSGYGGEGPRGFSYVLGLLLFHGADIQEYEVDEAVIDRLDASALTQTDIKRLDSAKPRRPMRLHDYIDQQHSDKAENGTLWKEFRPIVPLAIVDSRLAKLAISFWGNPDGNLLTGYRRLEDIVRGRTGIEDEQSARLFSKAFLGEEACLGWPTIAKPEQIGRANLFVNAYMAHRNPRAHQEKTSSPNLLSEFLLLNHLYLLESEAVNINRT